MLTIKLKALVREHLGHLGHELVATTGGSDADGANRAAAPPNMFGRGAALIVDGAAWILLDEPSERGLGPALAWVSRQPDIGSLSIIAESATGVLARRAPLFTLPVSVWQVTDRTLSRAVPESYQPPAVVDPAHEVWREVIEQGGADAVDEHGVLSGEVRGLEVCRVVTDAQSGEVRLEVGVGAHDRELFMMLHGDRPKVEALARVVESVVAHREEGAPLHPLNRLGAERFLRWQVLNSPGRVGATTVRSADPPVARANLKDSVPCVALGESTSGVPLVVVCSVGIDLDLVPFAVDARQMHAPDATVVLVVPERDASPVTKRVASMASGAVTVVSWAERAAMP